MEVRRRPAPLVSCAHLRARRLLEPPPGGFGGLRFARPLLEASALRGGSVLLAHFGAFVPASSHFLKSKQKNYDKSTDFAEFDVNGFTRFCGVTTKLLICLFLS